MTVQIYYRVTDKIDGRPVTVIVTLTDAEIEQTRDNDAARRAMALQKAEELFDIQPRGQLQQIGR